MNHKKMARMIAHNFAAHKSPVDIELHESLEGGELLIFNVSLKPGTKESGVFNCASDIRTALGIELFQPFKEGLCIRLAVSKKPITDNSLQKMLTSPTFQRIKMNIPIALGYDLRGDMKFADLTEFPHALYGGATNSGKTVGLRSLIVSIIAKQPVSKANLLIIDTGATGLDLFDDLPHLSCKIVKDTDVALFTMKTLFTEMERRIALHDSELRSLPALICIVDEFLTLIDNINGTDKDTFITLISNLLRRGRHAKIHVVLATQESAKKDMQISLNNLYTRMAFKCSDFYSSRSILGTGGADKLPGKGAMLYKQPEHPDPLYIQGANITKKEIKRLVTRIIARQHDTSNKFVIPEMDSPQYTEQTTEGISATLSKPSNGREKELAGIIFWALGQESVSVHKIKQNFDMGNRANDVMTDLRSLNLVAEKYANQPSDVIPACYDDLAAEVVNLLNRYGYTEDATRNAFAVKNGGA